MSVESTNPITRWLERAPLAWSSVYAVVMAFTTYFCMYSFRKPFSVGTYAGSEFWIFDLKSALVISQLCGYALSKMIGIKFNSELLHKRRLLALIGLVLSAEAALLLFAVVPPQAKVFVIFLNGLPLGAVWGVVFSFLEGRRTSEILGAGLSCSFIVASGFVKTAGKDLLSAGVSESWMPATTGAIFLPVFLAAAYGLSLLPPPSAADVAARTVRAPMDRLQRRQFARRYWFGLSLLLIAYLFMTAYRDFRDNYAAEIWIELGMGDQAAIFTKTEVPIAGAVLVVLGLLYLIKNNRLGLAACYAVMLLGSVLVGVATLLFDLGLIDPIWWMTLVGLGLYLGYVPYGCMLFDRTIAALHTVATAVFLIYISDAVAYGGSVVAVLYKQFGEPSMSFFQFFRSFSYLTCGVTFVCLLVSCAHFLRESPVESARK